MTTAHVVPAEMPTLPEGCTGWARSTRRAGSVYHAHVLGFAACKTIRLDRFKCEAARGLRDMQYWGVCKKCFQAAKA